MAIAVASDLAQANNNSKSAKELLKEQASDELIFAVVGHVGSGTSTIAQALKEQLENNQLEGGDFTAHIIKARTVIEDWAAKNDISTPSSSTTITAVEKYQDLGDAMRKSGDNSAVAKGFIEEITKIRSKVTGKENGRKAYILDSIRHPTEVLLLRHVYQDAFILIGVVCSEDTRSERITEKYSDGGKTNAKKFMQRDSKAVEKYGQRTSDAFHLSDFFAENSANRFLPSATEEKVENSNWFISDALFRLLKIVTYTSVVRPTTAETSMHHAYSAQLRSSCLSRQVGAALVDKDGNVVATGTNEPPKAGGGVYGEEIENNLDNDSAHDHRCVFSNTPHCSNTFEQKTIIKELLDNLPEYKDATAQKRKEIEKILRSTRVGDLIEFSRAIHAEMDAILSASRIGVSAQGKHLFVTTFPCHYCARHIVTAGVDEVQFIEPYPKSAAVKQHSDAITINPVDWIPPSKGGKYVLFKPFSGVAPRLYRRAFVKNSELKNKETGEFEIGELDWVDAWHLRKKSYLDLEKIVLEETE